MPGLIIGEMQQAKLRAQRPWEVWLSHAAAAVTAASCTSLVMIHLAPVRAVETKQVASAASPGCAEPTPPPAKARVRE